MKGPTVLFHFYFSFFLEIHFEKKRIGKGIQIDRKYGELNLLAGSFLFWKLFIFAPFRLVFFLIDLFRNFYRIFFIFYFQLNRNINLKTKKKNKTKAKKEKGKCSFMQRLTTTPKTRNCPMDGRRISPVAFCFSFDFLFFFPFVLFEHLCINTCVVVA